MAAPTAEHLATMKLVLCYVTGIIDYRRRNGEARLTGFSDSDLAGYANIFRNTT
jgi:hypothetical protein